MTTPRDCERGVHAALVAQAPLEGDDSIEIDYICPVCRSIEYTLSYGKDAWARELVKRAELESRRGE